MDPYDHQTDEGGGDFIDMLRRVGSPTKPANSRPAKGFSLKKADRIGGKHNDDEPDDEHDVGPVDDDDEGETEDEDRAPSLGDDILTIRQKAKKVGLSTAGVSAGKTRSTPAAATVAPAPAPPPTQVDLNDEKNLADLEDPSLMKHVREARDQLARWEEGRSVVPSTENLIRDDKASRQAISQAITAINEQKMALQCAIEEATLNGTNVGRIVAGEKPHSYPQAGMKTENLKHLQKKIESNVASFTDVYQALERIERDIVLFRRLCETVVDGYAATVSVVRGGTKK